MTGCNDVKDGEMKKEEREKQSVLLFGLYVLVVGSLPGNYFIVEFYESLQSPLSYNTKFIKKMAVLEIIGYCVHLNRYPTHTL